MPERGAVLPWQCIDLEVLDWTAVACNTHGTGTYPWLQSLVACQWDAGDSLIIEVDFE